MLQWSSGTTCACLFGGVLQCRDTVCACNALYYVVLAGQAAGMLAACWLQSVTWQLPPGCSIPCTLLIGRPWFRLFRCNACFQLLIVSCGLLLSARQTHNAWHMLLQFQLHSYSKVWCGGYEIRNTCTPQPLLVRSAGM